MSELMSIDEVAAYFGVSRSRAYTLVSENRIQRVSGYPADKVKAILRLGQGARTDLDRLRAQGREQVGPRSCCTRASVGQVGNCSVCGWVSPSPE